MTTCSAYGCSNRSSRKKKGVTFHLFPNDPKLRKAWIYALKRKNFKPSRYSRLCSEHFTEDQIDRSGANVRLKENAVPTVFNFPPYLKKILAEKEEIEKTYEEQQDESSEFGSFDGSDKSDVKLHEEKSCKEGVNGTNTAEASEYLAKFANIVANNSENDAKSIIVIKEPLTVTPYIHKPVVDPNQRNRNNSPHTSFKPAVSSVVSVPLLRKVVHYVPEPCLNEPPESIISATDKAFAKNSYIEDLKRTIKAKDKAIDKYKKKIKILNQSNRRYKKRLANLKHSIFTELQRREYLSSDSSYKIESKSCLLDRNSIKICESESEDSDEQLQNN